MTDNTWNGYSEDELRELTEISERYKNCLDGGKTERECASLVIREAERAGYRELGEYIKKGAQLRPGDRIYAVCMNKT
ncbi:MAG: aminopeptidase, partial [Eubacteriaceae bacterium]|nr:aminopeptidase [Eubacteriaceae bacterium]